ncbi:MAG: DUF6051 family protein [Deltaproteobacteria bacterium]|jgi:hypothetical protein|nr:DUF6051 family protein [Deltaproteobacteria bacterium]
MSNYLGLAQLRTEIPLTTERVELRDGLFVKNFTHVSQSHGLLANIDPSLGHLALGPTAEDPDYFALYHQQDKDIVECQTFRYHLMLEEGVKPQSLIFLIHGFNERSWSKYMPWAAHLAKRNKAAVLMFPMAFHMNRSPKLWNDTRAMKKVSFERQKLYPDVLCSTLSNAAISVRLQANPSRFFWSGLVAYHDIVDLATSIRAGGFADLDPNIKLHFFAYSIGAFLAEIVLFANANSLFEDSKLVAFCGGPVFNRLSPVTRFILDSEANVRLYSFLVEHLESHRRADPELAKHLSDSEPAGRNFRCLLNYRVDRLYREERFRELANRVYGLAMAQDEVVPPYEIIGTLRGTQRDINIPVDIVDCPYPTQHEDPFPVAGPNKEVAKIWLDKVLRMAAEFLA